MTLQPVLPPLLLAAVAVLVVVARVVVLRRRPDSERTRTVMWRWAGMTAAGLLLLLAAARPTIGSDEQAAARAAGDREPNVFVVLDRSADMSVRDVDGRTRMAAAHDDIAALIDRYPDARFSVLGFTSRPSVDWPLSADTWSLRPLLAAMTPEAAPDELTNVGAAGTVLRYQLISARQQFPRAQNLVFYLGAGAVGSEAPQRRFELQENAVDGGAVLNYGRTEVAALRGVADQIGVPYVLRSDTAPLAEVLPDDEGTTRAADATTVAARLELYWIFAGLAAILILIELYLTLREFRRIRPVDVGALP
ncbi:vWA domain-containing protein [Mycolicibacterium wolinskyi]|uniref:vWA domain-containing protein n=1 Tax=Mycolicibacterium wolinskyi TaxID=59750 RepID=UPI0039179A07